MTGTFSSFNTALSALRYNRVAMDVASGNIANAGTEGYARRQVIGQATGAPAVQAIWSTWPRNAAGDGVEAGGITRLVDPLLDRRARLEHASLSYGEARAASLARFETALAEPGDNGVAAALAAFKSAWHAVANNPGDSAARSQLLARAQTLSTAITSQDTALATEWSDQRHRADAVVTEVNEIADQLAKLNGSLLSAHVSGNGAGILLDQRDQLALRLAELTGAEITMKADTTALVKLGDIALVSGTTAADLAVTTVADPSGDPATPATDQYVLSGSTHGLVRVAVGGEDVTLGAGQLGGMLQVMNQDLPAYREKLDAFVNQLVTQTNQQHALGRDLDPSTGDGTTADGGDFFVSTGTTAATLAVAISDTELIAAATGASATEPGEGQLGNGNATALGNLNLGGSVYRQLIADFGVQVGAVNTGVTNQAIVVSQVDASRESISGISIDEEMVNLLAAQRGFEGAARVLSTVDSMLDTLINRMAV
jgi:flagellar hook-associated protein 1 FlgK